jgi:hypothetical protein
MLAGLRRFLRRDHETVGPSHHTRASDRVGRRWFLRSGAAAALTACSAVPRFEAPAKGPRGASHSVEVWSYFDLPATDSRSRELSGAAWDAKERVLWAVQDNRPRIVSLLPDPELRAWRFGDAVELDCGGPVDLEGLVVVPDGFIVCSEEGPRIIEVDSRGRFRHEIVLPARFNDALHNRSVESLTLSPNGRYLFTTTEVALKNDGGGATAQAGTRVRILRLDRTRGEVSEHTYETDPMRYDGGQWGVPDLAALGETELFVLERGWAKGHGNTVRVYETALDARASCADIDRLSPSSPVLPKTLLIDLSNLVTPGLPLPKQPQASALLDNYEGMTLGPRLPNGRPSLILVSDDNGHADQVARVLVLAI